MGCTGLHLATLLCSGNFSSSPRSKYGFRCRSSFPKRRLCRSREHGDVLDCAVWGIRGQQACFEPHVYSNELWSLLKLCQGQSKDSVTKWNRKSRIRCKISDNESRAQYSAAARIRCEVMAPFRAVRMFFYLAFIASGSVGCLITLTRFPAALGSLNEQALPDVLKDLGIDIVAVGVFFSLYGLDSKARDVQLSNLAREETLSALRVELGNKKVLTVAQLRGVARLVILAGPGSFIKAALEIGEPYKEALLDRGVLVVAFSTDGTLVSTPESAATIDGKSGMSVATVLENDIIGRGWRATPTFTAEWSKWLTEQKQIANVSEDKPVYISLRLDGRVRGSGVGLPPWQAFVAQLPPLKGIWGSALDGMDGRI